MKKRVEYRLTQAIVIPEGTVVSAAPHKRDYGVEHFDVDVAFGEDSTGTFTMPFGEALDLGVIELVHDKADFTAEDARTMAKVYGSGRVYDMLNHLSERIKADESAEAVAFVDENVRLQFLVSYTEQYGHPEIGTKLFAHPPAQAAQVDRLRSALSSIIVECEQGLLTPADTRKLIAAIARTALLQSTAPTAEPAAQVDAMKVLARLARHADDCLSHNVLPTGAGNWHCDCGYDRYVLDGEPTAAAFAPTAESVALPRCWDAQGNPCCDAPTAEPAAQGEACDSALTAYRDAWNATGTPWRALTAVEYLAHQQAALAAAAQPRAVPDVAAMVNRFLGWRLPDDFYPDGGISFTHVTNPSWTHDSWPIGTNLFTAAQAEQMFRYVLAVPASQAPIYCCTHCKLPNHEGIDHADCEDAAASRAMLAAAPSPGESE